MESRIAGRARTPALIAGEESISLTVIPQLTLLELFHQISSGRYQLRRRRFQNIDLRSQPASSYGLQVRCGRTGHFIERNLQGLTPEAGAVDGFRFAEVFCTMDRKTTDPKKAYESPALTRISLRPEEAVLGNCKSLSSGGPVGGTCSSAGPCRTLGS